jgi:anti-sigma factor RsiW
MNKCTDNDLREMLPDLLHGALSADVRERAEAHLATCEECREDLKILRAVKSAAVFAPVIDANRVVRQIPPYRTIGPAPELPARPRLVSWLVAASLAVTVVGVGSLLVTRQVATKAPVAVTSTQTEGQIVTPPESVASKARATVTPPDVIVSTAQPRTHALALAADVDGLSDGNLMQLMNEMNRFDALPASEPDPVISVDSGY